MLRNLAAALLSVVLLIAFVALAAGCGGGDDNPDPNVCYVEGKPMPPRACR